MAALTEASLCRLPVAVLSTKQNSQRVYAASFSGSLDIPTFRLAPSAFSRTRGEWRKQTGLCVASGAAQPITEAQTTAEDTVPLPVVVIDQHSEPGATVLDLQFGDRLGALLDTMKALTDLGLNVLRAKVTTEDSVGRNRFVITRSDTGGKVEDPDMLEAIRLTVIANLLQYHPESSERLALAAIKFKAPQRPTPAIATQVLVEDIPGEEGRSVLSVETSDRPGLVMEIVRILGDLSINVVSAEIDTEGLVAKDQFYVSYHGEALNKSMREVVTNTLRYYLTKPEIESEDSY